MAGASRTAWVSASRAGANSCWTGAPDRVKIAIRSTGGVSVQHAWHHRLMNQVVSLAPLRTSDDTLWRWSPPSGARTGSPRFIRTARPPLPIAPGASSRSASMPASCAPAANRRRATASRRFAAPIFPRAGSRCQRWGFCAANSFKWPVQLIGRVSRDRQRTPSGGAAIPPAALPASNGRNCRSRRRARPLPVAGAIPSPPFAVPRNCCRRVPAPASAA